MRECVFPFLSLIFRYTILSQRGGSGKPECGVLSLRWSFWPSSFLVIPAAPISPGAGAGGSGGNNFLGDLPRPSPKVGGKKRVSVGLHRGKMEKRRKGRKTGEQGQGILVWESSLRVGIGNRGEQRTSRVGPLGLDVPRGSLPSISHTDQGHTGVSARVDLEQEVWSE